MNWRVFLLVFLLPTLVCAQTAPYRAPYIPPAPQLELKPIPPGKDIILRVGKGEKVPFDGQLFDNVTALRWGNYLEQYRLRLQLCHQQQQQLSSIDQVYFDAMLASERKASKRVVDDLEARLHRVEDQNAKLQGELSKGPPWYNTRSFGIGIGVVGTVAVVALSAWALSSVSR